MKTVILDTASFLALTGLMLSAVIFTLAGGFAIIHGLLCND